MQLLDFYKNVLHLTDETLIDEVIRATEIKVLKRGDFLIRAGQLPTHACFLMKGIIRGTMLDCIGDKTVLSIPADLRKPSPQTEDRQLSVYCRTAV